MVAYREILRPSSDSQNSQRGIAARVHSSRNTIRKVRKAAQEAGITWPLEEDITNEVLWGILSSQKFAAGSAYAVPDCPYIRKELARPGVTLTALDGVSQKVRGGKVNAIYVHVVLREVPAVGSDHKSDDADPAQARGCLAGGLGREHAGYP